MSRSNGKIYKGFAKQTGNGSGTISVTIDNDLYQGNYSRTSSQNAIGFNSLFASNGPNTVNGYGNSFASGANITLMALLQDSQGRGLRCFLNGDQFSRTGGGNCIDFANNVYDVTYQISNQ